MYTVFNYRYLFRFQSFSDQDPETYLKVKTHEMLTSMDLLNELLLLLVVEVHVPLGQPRLPRPVLYHHKPDHPAPHPSAKKKDRYMH